MCLPRAPGSSGRCGGRTRLLKDRPPTGREGGTDPKEQEGELKWSKGQWKVDGTVLELLDRLGTTKESRRSTASGLTGPSWRCRHPVEGPGVAPWEMVLLAARPNRVTEGLKKEERVTDKWHLRRMKTAMWTNFQKEAAASHRVCGRAASSSSYWLSRFTPLLLEPLCCLVSLRVLMRLCTRAGHIGEDGSRNETLRLIDWFIPAWFSFIMSQVQHKVFEVS